MIYSIISSAQVGSAGRIIRPNALAVSRLTSFWSTGFIRTARSKLSAARPKRGPHFDARRAVLSVRLAEHESEGHNKKLIAPVVTDMQNPVTPITEAAPAVAGFHDTRRLIPRLSEIVHYGAATIDENLLRVGAVEIYLGLFGLLQWDDWPSQPLHLRLLGPATCENDAPCGGGRRPIVGASPNLVIAQRYCNRTVSAVGRRSNRSIVRAKPSSARLQFSLDAGLSG